MLRIKRPFTTIAGIAFDGAAGSGSDAVVEAGGAGGNVREINFRDCIIRNGPAQCLKVIGGSGSAPVNILCSYDRCTFANNGSGALVSIGIRDTEHVFRRCTFTDFTGSAVDLDTSEGIGFYECSFSRQLGGSGSYLLARRNSASGRIVGCTFDEDVTPSARQWFVELQGGCKGWSIVGCRFIRRFTLDSTVKAILVGENVGGAPGCFGNLILNPMIQTTFTPSASPQQIEIRTIGVQNETVIVGGFLEVIPPGTPAIVPIDVVDGSRMTIWISHRRWRLAQILSSENPASAKKGDLTSHLGRGLEAWNAESTYPAWVPLTVNRFTNATDVPATSRSIGTIVWETSTNKLKVFTDTGTWKEIPYV